MQQCQIRSIYCFFALSHELSTESSVRPTEELKLSKLRIDKLTLLLVALCIFGTFLVLLRGIPYGTGVNGDGVIFMSTARNLLAGNGFVKWDGSPFVERAPMFPMLLAFIGIFGPDPLDVAGYVNATLFGLTIFVSSLWLRYHLLSCPAPTLRAQRTWLLIWAVAALVLAPFTRLASDTLSDPLFILLVVSTLFTFDKFLDTGQRAFLLLAAIFTALTCLTRYIGVAIPATLLLFLLCRKGDTLLAKAKNMALYSLIAVTPIVVWLLRNLLVTGSLAGQAWPIVLPVPGSTQSILVTGSATGYNPRYSLSFNLYTTFTTLADWVLPRSWIEEMQKLSAQQFSIEITPQNSIVLAMIIILTLLILAVGAWVCFLHLPRHRLRQIILFATFTFVYTVLLIIGVSVRGIESVTNRYLAPVYIPMLFIAVLVLDEFFQYALQRKLLGTLRFPWVQNMYAEGRTAGLTMVVMALLSCWLWLPVNANAQHIRQAQENGLPGYNSRTWAESEIIRYINENPCARCVFYSPNAPGLYFLTAQPRQFYLPRQLTDDGLRQIESMQRNGEDVYIVWFSSRDRIIRNFDGYTYGRSQLEAWLALETVADLADGIIYRLKR